jgi:DNA-binding NtrC family response regulator
MRVLIADDERSARQVLVHYVSLVGDVEVHEASSVDEAKGLLDRHCFDAMLVDLRLSQDDDELDGLKLVEEARSRSILAVVVSGSHDVGAVRTAMRMGAHDYVLKDQLTEELIVPVLRSIQSQRALEREVIELRSRRGEAKLPWLIGSSPPMQQLRTVIQRVAVSDRPVLVTGPTGSGKELVVRAIHTLGPHPEAPLLDLNCGAFPEALVESQLFGHERGAFTGAEKKHDGFFTAAGNGTVFLDEIAELPLELQAKLLRVLETGTFRPIGATQSRRFMGRVICATFANLEERVEQGKFREDLFYRLNVLEVRVASLDDRREDIPLLLARFAESQPRPLAFSAGALERVQQMRWPGNVRQLRNFVDRLAVFAPEGPITPEVVDQFAGTRSKPPPSDPVADFAREILKMDVPDKLAFAENALIEQALRLAEGNKTAAARLLGVHRKVVERRTVGGSDDRVLRSDARDRERPRTA